MLNMFKSSVHVSVAYLAILILKFTLTKKFIKANLNFKKYLK